MGVLASVSVVVAVYSSSGSEEVWVGCRECVSSTTVCDVSGLYCAVLDADYWMLLLMLMMNTLDLYPAGLEREYRLD